MILATWERERERERDRETERERESNSAGQCTKIKTMTSLTLCAQETSAANRRADNIHCKDSPATGQGWRDVIGQNETEGDGGQRNAANQREGFRIQQGLGGKLDIETRACSQQLFT